MDCPYLEQPYRNAANETVFPECTGTKHVFDGGKSTSCRLYDEAKMYARSLGVRGSVDLDSFESKYQSDAFDAVVAWVKSPVGQLVLSGPTGCGKSRLALGAWYAIRRQRKFTLIATATEFFRSAVAAATFREDSNIERYLGLRMHEDTNGMTLWPDHLNPLNHPLIFDELGGERDSDVFREYYKELLGKRPNMLITTNLDLRGISSRYGDRILSRMRTCLWVQMEATDRRTMFDISGD